MGPMGHTHTGTELPNGGQPPWGGEVPPAYQTAERSSPVGAGNLATKLDTCTQLPTSCRCAM